MFFLDPSLSLLIMLKTERRGRSLSFTTPFAKANVDPSHHRPLGLAEAEQLLRFDNQHNTQTHFFHRKPLPKKSPE